MRLVTLAGQKLLLQAFLPSYLQHFTFIAITAIKVNMFNIVLVRPQIPPNTGNIIRLCVNNGCKLHLIEPLGFTLDEKNVRRAGMDYRDLAMVRVWPDYETLIQKIEPANVWSYSTKSTRHYTAVKYTAGDCLVFGSETDGLPDSISQSVLPEHRLHIPMQADSRSLNLSNAVAIVSYEAWRQAGFSKTPVSELNRPD